MGVKIFDPSKSRCLQCNWSKTGFAHYLSQKHCQCESTSPGCCEDGLRITLCGSRFLRKSEERYAPVEGEALSVAWGLEHSKYFRLGCDDLLPTPIRYACSTCAILLKLSEIKQLDK